MSFAGKDSKGLFPESAIESYSAMVNTEGGYIVFGIEEKSIKIIIIISSKFVWWKSEAHSNKMNFLWRKNEYGTKTQERKWKILHSVWRDN